MNKLEITKPDDWHVHFREGELLEKLVPETSNLYNRAIVMPNLKRPINSLLKAQKYKNNILKFSKNNSNFIPLMTFYLQDDMDPDELIKAHKNNTIFAAKLYPSGATTNSSNGVKKISNIFHIFEKMSLHKIPLLIHGEVNDRNIDVFDREKMFIENYLTDIIKNFPELKITLEHITTKFAVDFVNSANENLKASITPHHLILNRTDMLEHKIKPHYYCLPILKRETDRKALLEAAFNVNQKFFMGTDSAPHDIHDKESSCGCAGVFNTIKSVQILTQIFDNHHQIDKLENFISINGPKHYQLKQNFKKIILIKQANPIDFKEFLHLKNFKIKIFKPNFDVYWEIHKEKEW